MIARPSGRDTMPAATIYDIAVTTIDGSPLTLDAYRGSVWLVVNVASACGFTPQYRELERLHRDHQRDGLVVLGFPCNQFGGQEPGDHAGIQSFCRQEYDVTFPLFAKVHVNGPDAHPLFKHLKAAKKGVLGTEAVKWNFTKFLVGRDGRVIARYGSAETPRSIEPHIVRALAERSSAATASSGGPTP